ncbi:MAG: Tex family protein [candidate division Zixibacteria bacterium]|nr:Tex family protein [candidate division Zixibacteria bacterium]
MPGTHITIIAQDLGVRPAQVAATIDLLDQQATVPFIARYRKEATGSLDEVAITAIRDRLRQLRELDQRREAILKSLTERELLTDELRVAIESAGTMAALEDIYLPYRPKRRTRAMVARERGLEPLAELILEQTNIDPHSEAEAYVDAEKGVPTSEDALAGARDIIAEWISEDVQLRAELRRLFAETGVISSEVITGKETEGAKFRDYFDWHEPVAQVPSHRLLAMRRGENAGVLRVHIAPEESEAIGIVETAWVDGAVPASEQVRLACHDSYKRLLAPAMETEIAAESKERADTDAIRVFSKNLRELLMAPPLGRKSVLAIDPGFRTGCKVVCLDKQGKLVDHTTIYPHTSDNQRHDAEVEIKALCEKHQIRVIAIGNGTAGRETEAFIRGLAVPGHPLIEMVNEAGASVYSASEAAREEFSEYDLTVRGAVSIGRRLIDPLAELIKIDPKAIGVGQYQHDVDQSALRQSLDDTVTSSVNQVGVEVNTASKQLLTFVSGVGPALAENIVRHRDENGPFKSRKALQKVPRLGPKAFEQAAGFLRITDAENPLDRSAVHPESYHVVESMAARLGCTVLQLMQDEQLRQRVRLEDFVSDRIGMPTLVDIMAELAKPGRDPRPEFVPFSFDSSVKALEDLKPGMRLPGVITNVTAFGAFVDIGVHQDGLLHKSEMAERYVNDPSKVVKMHQKVTVRVLEVDLERKRISLSMRPKED